MPVLNDQNKSKQKISVSFRPIVTSKEFRNRVLKQFPKAAKNPSYLSLIGYLAFGDRHDEDTGRLLLSAEVLASIEGKLSQFNNRNYDAKRFLEAFKRDIVNFGYSNHLHSPESGIEKVRQLKSIDWPEDFRLEIETEKVRIWQADTKVYLDSGIEVTPKTIKKIRDLEQSEVLELLDKSGCDVAHKLLNYLNNLDHKIFERQLANIPQAVEAALKVKDCDRQLSILRQIVSQSKPFYKPVSKTTRIYGANSSILMLEKSVRKALCCDWSEFDLKSAQLSILAHDWHVPVITEFLESGGSIWKSLAEHFDKEYTPELKGTFKPALYACAFGGRKWVLNRIFKECGFDRKDVRLFMDYPIIAALLKARRREMKLIREQGGSSDCFGNWLALTQGSFVEQDNFSQLNKVDERSILAARAQAYELKLLEPVIDLAIKNNKDGFTITLFQHDGMSIKFNRKSRAAYFTEIMQLLVKGNAKALGIVTELEINK